MLRIDKIVLAPGYTEKDLKKAILGVLRVTGGELFSYEINKKSIDARKKDFVHYLLTVDVCLKNPSLEKNIARKNKQVTIAEKFEYGEGVTIPKDTAKPRVLIAGAGPAGLFCAYFLAKYGFSPVLIERGDDIAKRTEKVEEFWKTGVLDPESNVQFGAGGAGTYSDGKLNTAIKDTSGRIRAVLKAFVECGAPEDILYNAKPHIGTDVLKTVVSNMIGKITEMGGKVLFRTMLKDIKTKDGRVTAGVFASGEEWPCDAIVLAIGHSARDTFNMLYEKGILMEPKDFAVGLRIEHPQEMINADQYGSFAGLLPAAPYKLTYTTESGRGVYSFCMCPGGYVVNASSENGRLAVNGMSYRARDSKNANSALIVTVGKQDFDGFDPLSGVRFQQKLEESAFRSADGAVPQQLLKDFNTGTKSSAYGDFGSCVRGRAGFADLNRVLPEAVAKSLKEAIPHFEKTLPGFARGDAILSGVESRTSSPLRILRNEHKQCNILGLYPCGEGAGYAGGIVSAAVDGIKVMEEIAQITERRN